MIHPIRFLFLFFLFTIAAVQLRAQTGIPPFGSFGGGPEVVNLANLNAHWTIPVLHKAGRGPNFSYDLSYDSLIWYPVGIGINTTWEPTANWGWTSQSLAVLGYLKTLTTGQSQFIKACNGTQTTYTTTYTYLDSRGLPHPFPGSTYYTYTSGGFCPPGYTYGPTLTAVAPDGSGYTLTAPANQSGNAVTTTSGTVVYTNIGSNGGSGTYQDRNGNELTVNNGTGQFFDTLSATTPVLTQAGSGTPNSALTYTYTAPSGASAQYKMSYVAYTVATNFAVSGINDYGATAVNLVDKITLPDNSFYQFTYEQTPSTPSTGACTPKSGTYQNYCVTGRIVKVTLPVGGQITYTYTGGAGTNNSGIFSDGSTATLTRATPDGTWTYAQVKGSGAASTTTMTDPQSNQTVIQFQGIYETLRQVSQLINGSQTVLRQWVSCYNGSTSNCSTTAITLPITQKLVTAQFGTNGSYADQYLQYDNYGLLTVEATCDYPNCTSRLRSTWIGYASLGNGIVDMPAFVTICNGSGSSSSCGGTGTVVKQTIYAYDQGNVSTSTGTPQHVSVTGARGNVTTIYSYVSGSTYLTSTFTYWDTGTVNSATDVNLGVTTYSYHDATSTCGNAFPTGITEAISSLKQSYTWNCPGGVQASVIDENNQTTTTTWNDPYFWRPASVTDPTNAATAFCYGLITSGVCSLNPNQSESTLNVNSGNSTVDNLLTFDGLGRSHVSQLRQSPGATSFDSAETDYDAVGRSNRGTLPYSGTAGQLNSTGPASTVSYDALGRTTTVSDAGGGSVTYAYSTTTNDVLVTIGPAPSGESTKQRQLEFDALGHLTSVCEITTLYESGTCSQATAQTGFWTKYTWDPLGQSHGRHPECAA